MAQAAFDSVRPNAMMIEMTEDEQRLYLHHDASTEAALPNLPPTMPDGTTRKISIAEMGYCSDTRYLEKLQEKEMQHSALEDALKNYGYNVTVLTYIMGFGGSLYTSNMKALKTLGIDGTAANSLSRKHNKPSVICAHNILKCKRFLERQPYRQARHKADPP